MIRRKEAEQLANQLRGLLSAPDVGIHILPSEIEIFATNDLLHILDVTQLSGIVPHNVFGKRMEQLLKHAILASERYDVIAENIQIIENNLTIGELDFILHDLAQNRLIHLELAVKFYVYDPTLPEEMQRWIGPNRRDSLVRKLDKLKSHQFPLIYRPETQSTLQNLDLPDLPITQALCFKTMLFVPEGQQTFTPEVVSPNALSGTWIRYSDFHHLRGNSFYLPEKPEWICDLSSNKTWNDLEQVRVEIEDLISRKRSPMCWMKYPDGQTERFFVVWW